ncbi:MAG: SDR family NAD(P)-dependent oxidoreductase [Eubacteriales bacterium]|nr:SDR family NAD(P)-dependent oxidoreductase [Eubacteriales bacterium]
MKMVFDEFKGKTAVVTGAASGMGLLCAQRLAENGANVVLADMDEERVKQAADEIVQAGGSAIPAVVDVRYYEQVEAVATLALERFQHVDILINCAGGYSARILQVDGYFPTMEPSAIDWGIDVNLKGPTHFARAILKHMIDQNGGVIINVGSTCGTVGNSALDYSAAKSGVMNGLTKSIALYGAKHGVRCCCVTPGPVLTRPSMAGMATPLGFAAEPWEVVNLILYLCSDNARSMTGAEYLIDGGRSATALDAAGID